MLTKLILELSVPGKRSKSPWDSRLITLKFMKKNAAALAAIVNAINKITLITGVIDFIIINKI
jgi:hypothetical protein